MTQVPDGFIAHLYTVCEQISPVLAWGFLGPKNSLHDFCCFFKVCMNLLFLIGSIVLLVTCHTLFFFLVGCFIICVFQLKHFGVCFLLNFEGII